MKNETHKLEFIIRRLVWLAEEKGKFIVLLLDQFNLKMDYRATETLFAMLRSFASHEILITTNTDTKIEPFKRPDGNNVEVFVLNEIDNPIDLLKLSKVTLKLFPKTKADFRDSLISEMHGNLNMVFLFYNYFASKKLLNLKDDELLEQIQNFCRQYISDNQEKHDYWVKNDEEFKKQLGEMMLLVDTGGSVSKYSTLLRDEKYLYKKNGVRLFSINPLIQRMFQQLYWSANKIERFLNSHRSEIGGSPFGKLFEFYLKLKIKEMNENKKPLVLRLANGKFLKLGFNQVNKVWKNKLEDPKSQEKEANRFQIIKYEKLNSSNENVLFETFQKNFPLFEWQHTDFQENIIFHNMISVKHNGDLITLPEENEAFQNYARSYGDQAKAQLGIFYHIFIFLYLMILGDGIQRIIYIFYKDKNKAEIWFQKNMKHFAGGIEVSFFEFRDIKKEYPENFLLDENIDVRQNEI